MTQDKILQKVQEIFRDVFDDESLVITEATTANDIEEWDSLTDVALIDCIEKSFKIKFALGELRELNRVGDILEAILKKINQEYKNDSR